MEVVGLTKQSRDTPDSDIESFIREHNLNYAIGREDGSMSEAYAVTGIPAAAIVRNGTVVWRGHPGSLSDSMIEGFIAK